MGQEQSTFQRWFEALYQRHTRQLTFQEIRRALQALSGIYVHRRDRLAAGAALHGAGKRAAFALFYGPLHWLLVEHVVHELGAPLPSGGLVDLGCGTGVAGAAWAALHDKPTTLVGIDCNAWALKEAQWTFDFVGLQGRTIKQDLTKFKFPHHIGVVAAFSINELSPVARERLLPRLLSVAAEGGAVLILEPIAKTPVTWWQAWETAFEQHGGRADLWKIPVKLPERLRLLDKAAGLRHHQLKARTLYLPPAA